MFTTAGLYLVGAWLVMQAADVFFPGWDLPDKAINVLLVAAVVGLPLALVFGWFFNITARGIMRTLPSGPGATLEPRPLGGNDYLVLAALVLVAGGILSYTTVQILSLRETSPEPLAAEKAPNSIAVLPFENISDDPQNEIFSSGVSEEIRNRLGHYAELRVVARTSSFQFRRSEYGIPRISDLLGVRYLLQGSVRRQADRIRVSAQLVAEDGTHLWSENYDRIVEDVFRIQDEIADLVAAEVTPQIVAGLEGSYRPSLEAFQHFLAGRDLIYQRNQWAAQKELAMAVALDPAYAEAQAEYAVSLLLGYPGEQELQKASAAIDAALKQVPDSPRALAARGLYLSVQSPPDPVAAEAVLLEALRHDPNMVDAMNWLGGALVTQGKNARADEWAQKAYALDPFNSAIATNMAKKFWEEGNPERAEAMLLRLVDLPEPPLQAMMFLYDLYADTGRLVEASRMAKRLLLAGGSQYYFLARNYAALGKIEVAAEWMSVGAREHPEMMWVRTGWVQAQAPCWAGDYPEAAVEMRQAQAANGLSLEQTAPALRLFYGINLALAGDHAGAIDTLAQNLPGSGDPVSIGGPYEVDAYQALAWSYANSGMPDKSRALLQMVDDWIVRKDSQVETMRSEERFEAARNAVLLGDVKLALDRLEQAVAAGWRDYYIQRHDPRWHALLDHPRYQASMAEVKADVDRQRAVVERIDAEENFPALLDAVRESQKSRIERDSN